MLVIGCLCLYTVVTAANIVSHVSVAVFFAYVFFSGDIYKYVPANQVSNYVKNYTPELNYYLVPVIVSTRCCETLYNWGTVTTV